ncbi:hypothetical protein BT63DRAFT_454424 [Microthyrium microscopicum]|uniref:F-box domain-containing protein n=1 Tax=Microthyrium microscopicum TaxID=703497 RepID=A0A6A6UFA8_9PEZI|nr:hypothetical protein BT63DRAFT_454424 [Microthyrium microscopicum]
MSSYANLSKLPGELIIMISNHLSITERIAIGHTCSRLRKLYLLPENNQSIIKQVEISWPEPHKAIRHLWCTNCNHVKSWRYFRFLQLDPFCWEEDADCNAAQFAEVVANQVSKAWLSLYGKTNCQCHDCLLSSYEFDGWNVPPVQKVINTISFALQNCDESRKVLDQGLEDFFPTGVNALGPLAIARLSLLVMQVMLDPELLKLYSGNVDPDAAKGMHWSKFLSLAINQAIASENL